MGIPSYFSYIVKNYSNIIKSISYFYDVNNKIDHLIKLQLHDQASHKFLRKNCITFDIKFYGCICVKWIWIYPFNPKFCGKK